jgi:transposase
MSVTDAAEPVEPPHDPASRPTGGVDWAKDDHAVAVVAPDGEQTLRFSITHDAAGLRTLVRRLLAAGVGEVGIERPDGPVVDALRQAGLVVYVLPPGQLKNLRSRYGSAGNKDDRFDAYVLADVVRTDRRRLRPLLVDTPATTALRQSVRARKDLVGHRVAVANQLRAHLQICFPGAVGLFADIDSDISTQIEALAARIAEQLQLHPDQAIFTSLPRSGCVRAARLLAEIGDARGRFPTADSLACLAGVAPSTRQSGKVTVVSFRWGADKQLRDAPCDFAGDSRHANPWAADLYQRARARGHDHPHAVRILARAWPDVIWACWTTHTPYDPDRHGALQRILNQDQPTAA